METETNMTWQLREMIRRFVDAKTCPNCGEPGVRILDYDGSSYFACNECKKHIFVDYGHMRIWRDDIDNHTVISRGIREFLSYDGWKMKDIAKRWGVTPRRISQEMKELRTKFMDSINGLPENNDLY